MHHAGAETRCHPLRPFAVARLDIGREAVIRVVGDRDRLLFRIEGNDRKHRSEHFLARDPHGIVDIGEDRRPDEISGLEAFRLAGAAGQERRALGNARFDQRLHPLELNMADERADMGAILRRIADPRLHADAPGDFHDLVIGAALDEHACRGITGLAGIVEAFENAGGHPLLDIGIGKDDVRRLSAEFERNALDRIGGVLADGDTRPRRTGEGHHVDVLVLRQRSPGMDAVAIDEVEDAGRKARLFDHLGVEHGVQRREFAGFQDAGAAGRKRRDDLERDLVDRPVPRRDETADADRLTQERVAVRQLFLEFQALQGIDEALKMTDAHIRLLLAAHRSRRTEFGRDGVGHFIVTPLVDREQLFEQRQPFLDARPAIACECLLGGCNRPVDVGSGAERDNRYRLLGRRIEHQKIVLRGRLNPFAVDVEFPFVEHSLLHPV